MSTRVNYLPEAALYRNHMHSTPDQHTSIVSGQGTFRRSIRDRDHRNSDMLARRPISSTLQPRQRSETNSGIACLEFGRAVKGPRLFQSSADVVLLAPLGTLLCEVPTGDRSSDIILGDVVRERINCVCQVDSVSVSFVFGVATEVVNRES